MWGTYIFDVYRQQDAPAVRAGLEQLVGPDSGSRWATGGVYIFWNPDTREPVYVGIAGDFAERFAQHNGLRRCPASGCKRDQIAEYFERECDWLGYTVLALSSLSQSSTHRQRKRLALEDRALIDLNEALSKEAEDEIRALEGRLIALTAAHLGQPPRWNTSPGRLPHVAPAADEGALALAVGAVDCLLQARRSIRQLANEPEAAMYEEHLHGIRLDAVREAILSGRGVRNDVLRRHLERSWVTPDLSRKILDSGYLDARNPLTVGPQLDPPDGG